MNKILRSSKEFEKKPDASLTDATKLDLTAGLTDMKPKFPEPKGLIIPGTDKEGEEKLVESNELELPPDAAAPSVHQDGEDEDLQLYRAAARYVEEFMNDPAALDIQKVAEYAYQIIERAEVGPGMLRLAMRPVYFEAFLGAHPVNIAILATLLTEALRFDEQQQLRAVVAALVHDIGMSRLNAEILQHQRELTSQEKEDLRQHPNYSAEILRERLGENYEWLARVVQQEHERAQGQGYPNGLTIEAIDPVSQLIGLLDVYEAFTHPRRQHEAASPSRIVRQIIESKDQLFAPAMIKALLQAVSVYPIETYVLLNNGQIGRVISTHPKNPLRPIIELHTDHNRKPLATRKTINLTENPVLSIVRALDRDELRELAVVA
jgi:HD-GYP domain-containing protein (c-di-GMP phosphodiesterase class II)